MRQLFCVCSLLCTALVTFAQSEKLPGFDEMVQSKRDVWGEAAMRQPNGASYEFFKDLLPPPRYVHADFRHYPLVLCEPQSKVKARLISNGSGVNLEGGARSWYSTGTPFIFRVGPDETRFGEFLERTQHPTLAEGYLPIFNIRYEHDGNLYQLESFASTDPQFAEHALVFVKFNLAEGTNGHLAIQVESQSPLTVTNGIISNDKGEVLAWYDKSWKWERQRLVSKINEKKFATIAIASKPFDQSVASPLASNGYDAQRKKCAATWNEIVQRGMNVEVPEEIAQNAWRHLVIQNFMLMKGDRMHYSAGNQYDALYESEGSDAALGMMLWGFETEMKSLIIPLLDFTRKGLEYHQAGHKIDDVTRLYWQTRDAEFVNSIRPRWQKEIDRIVHGRTEENGLFPRERYCGDIPTPVYSLNSNAKCWRALQDFSAALVDMGDFPEAKRLRTVADEFHKAILAAMDKSVSHETQPPFIPIALSGEEQAHDPITHSRMGSYWNLMANYVIGTRLYPTGSEQELWLPHYLEKYGGLSMGMSRSGGAQWKTFWPGSHRTNPLYGLRYVIDSLRRDDVDRALVNFYGMLAHGFTRNTFNGAEGCSLTPTDEGGRIFYCPPNSASNAHWLWTLRHLLVQDFDQDGDGKPETLRLGFATPKRWLEDGKKIKVENAPTVFGPVSYTLRSAVNNGEVIADLDLPTRHAPEKSLLRIRVPEGFAVVSATAGAQKLNPDENGTVDISSLQGKQTVRFAVKRL
ncbi:MAG: hypothetical protein H0X66_14815 [Verrucomicrobia bacterium]|nr:hypothetical protein [Verrucomicrobiota bacterium]